MPTKTPPPQALSPKQIVRKYLKAITHGKPADMAKWAAADIKATQGAQAAQGLEALQHYSMTYRSRYPGWTIQVERIFGEGNWVAVAGTAGAGAAMMLPFLAQYRVARGKVAEVVIAVDGSVPLEDAPASHKMRLRPE
jgi:hypothetical protein